SKLVGHSYPRGGESVSIGSRSSFSNRNRSLMNLELIESRLVVAVVQFHPTTGWLREARDFRGLIDLSLDEGGRETE
ncbi:hypothetical protein PMAYCL1PPCAC_29700, partial [Pristionchus mayeri]